uniref:CASP-like protein n=1 Tax=Aegilops tauschii subsp. strangulata TaxID=200361 RepID=A0A453GJ06_AEGTS
LPQAKRTAHITSALWPPPAHHSHHLSHPSPHELSAHSNCHRSTPGRAPSASPPHLSAASRAEAGRQGMKRVAGSPGTWSGMALRLSQCVFAAASTFAMVSGFGYSNYSAFLYSLPSLPLLLISSPRKCCFFFSTVECPPHSCVFLQIHEHHS